MASRRKTLRKNRMTRARKRSPSFNRAQSISTSKSFTHFSSPPSLLVPSSTLFQKYSQALRTPFLMASLIPVLAASALAWHDGLFQPVRWAAAGLAVLLAHAGTNLANDYFDYRNGNYPNQKQGPTGGSFAIQTGILSPHQIVASALVCFLFSLGLFGLLAWHGSFMLLVLGVVGIAIGFFYTAPPLQLGYRHLGEVAIFLGMGPVLFQTVYFAQTGLFSTDGWMLSTFLGLLVTNVLLAAQLPDIEEDQASGKHTIAAVWGPDALSRTFLVSTLVGALALVYGVVSLGLPPGALLGLGGTLLSLHVYTQLRDGHALLGIDGALAALRIGGTLVVLGLLIAF
jgi:1,4-dihydroxy-2-naphthoate octaprenyltransferase